MIVRKDVRKTMVYALQQQILSMIQQFITQIFSTQILR